MSKISSAARRARAAVDPPDRSSGDLFNNPPSRKNRESAPPAFANSAPQNRAPASNRESSGNDSGEVGFEVRGFATDPKHSGYQILTNYESTYWRAFVGVPAWSLYEVLRSFCHNGNNVCYPSINYLLEVLGIKQRRVLTGWSTLVKGKNYYYPGLIEILQGGGLVIAELVGEGPMQRYLFHVNLTPDLLRPEQVVELPILLQSKHEELLHMHFAEMAEIASRRRPAKSATTSPPPDNMQNRYNSTKNMVEKEGMTICQTPMTNCHTPSDNLSPKQHQYNNTQLTNASTTNLINNNSGGLQEKLPFEEMAIDSATDVVVVALIELGLADNVVSRLTSRFKRERILEKIDYLAYLEEFHPSKVKNPRGWLRRAIEENYGPPDGYLTPEERAAQANGPDSARRASYAAYVDRDEVATTQAAQASAAAEREYLRASRRDLIRRLHAPDAATLAFWELVQTDVRSTMTPDHYALIAEASVLWMDEERLSIAIWNRESYRELLHPNRVKALARTISSLAKRKVTLICEYWDEEGQVVPPGTAPP